MAESNTIGEEAGLKIAEEMMEIGPMAWFSQNISIIWVFVIILSLIPVLWFSLATYYKRVSSLFYSNRVKAFFAFIAAEATLDIVGLTSGNNSVYWICALIGLGIYAYLLFSNSSIISEGISLESSMMDIFFSIKLINFFESIISIMFYIIIKKY